MKQSASVSPAAAGHPELDGAARPAEQRSAVAMSSPDIGAAEREAVAAVLESRWLSLGPYLEDFERSVADYVGTNFAVAVSSGTAGLHLALIGAGVRDGDLVVTTPFSFIASANPIVYEGGVPIFVDIDPVTLNIDTEQAAEAVEQLHSGGGHRWLPPALAPTQARWRRRPKAILPVHVFGQPAHMEPLLETARKYGLELIEDACEAIGSEYNGRKAGTFGASSVFAFYPNKQVTTGEGGIIVTDDPDKAALFRSLCNQGRDQFDAWLAHARLGYNYRLDELSAAVGLAQMRRVDALLERRARVADWYGQRLAGIDGIRLPHVAPETTRMSWFVYVIRLAAEINRDAVMSALAEIGIPARPYFPPIHLQPFYRSRFGYREGQFPVTEAVSRSTLALPFSGVMTEDEVDVVCEGLRSVLNRVSVRRKRARITGSANL
jgi:dTDP-4-amino-4,6-dideoxygalactose transaminase